MHPFFLSLSTTFKHMPPAPVPISGKNLRNEDQSWELWAADLWHHFGSRKYRRSLRFHASLRSPHKILPVTLCPEDVCCLKAVNGPSKKTLFPHTPCPPPLRQETRTLSGWCHKNELFSKHTVPLSAFFCQLVLGKDLINPNTSHFIAPTVERQGWGGTIPLGNQTCHKATHCAYSCWYFLPSLQPPPLPFLVLFLGITGCLTVGPQGLLSSLCRGEIWQLVQAHKTD